jgi:hypothetical protein
MVWGGGRPALFIMRCNVNSHHERGPRSVARPPDALRSWIIDSSVSGGGAHAATHHRVLSELLSGLVRCTGASSARCFALVAADTLIAPESGTASRAPSA